MEPTRTLNIEALANERFHRHKSQASAHQNPGQAQPLGPHRLTATLTTEPGGLSNVKDSLPSRQVSVHELVISTRYEPCYERLARLKAISIRDLLPGKHHRGRKLVVKVIAEGMNVNGLVSGVVEDGHGDGIVIILHHMPWDVKTEELLPLGAAIAIKQPYVDISVAARGQLRYCLRVDHPSDTHVLVRPGFDKQKVSSDEWRSDGVAALHNGDWHQSLLCFSAGIRQALPDVATSTDTLTKCALYRNQAIVLQDRGRHEQALLSASAAKILYGDLACRSGRRDTDQQGTPKGTGPPSDSKIEKRRALALYGLREWEACHGICCNLITNGPCQSTEAVSALCAKASARMGEASGASYDWKGINARVAVDQIYNEAADYSKLIEVKPAGTMGRGIFTRTAIAKGAVAFVQKAFAFARGDKSLQGPMIHVTHDMSASAPEIYFGEDLLRKTIFQLEHMGPKWRAAFFDLQRGSHHHHNDNTKTGTASSGCPDDRGESITASESWDDVADGLADPADQVYGKVIINTFVVHDILRLNSMHCGPSSQPDRDRGIWITASYLNHSCEANCNVEFFGDLLVVRPKRDVEAGQQLTISYVVREDFTQEEKRRALKQNWGFDCMCGICRNHAADRS